MAINYVAPQGPGNIRTSYSGGGGGGGGGVSPAAINAQQQNQLEYMALLQRAAATGATGGDMLQAQAQGDLIWKRAEASNWLNQQEMTQREVMDLKKKQNLVAEINNDPNLTPKEKADAILQLRTGIDIAKQRMQKMQMEAMAEMRKTQAEENEFQTKLLGDRVKRGQMTAEDRFVFRPDNSFRKQAEAMVDSLSPFLKVQNPGEYEKKIRDVMEDNGWGQRGTIQVSSGDIEWDKPASKGAGTSSTGGAGGAGKPFDKMGAMREAKEVATTLEGLDKDSPEFNKRVKELVDQKQAKSPEGKAAIKVQKVQETLGKHEALGGKLADNPKLTANQKQAGMFLLKGMNRLLEAYGPADEMPVEARAEFISLWNNLKPMLEQTEPSKAPPATKATPISTAQ